ncbi:L-aspartate oxidase [Aureibacter tunicatorum]|uniref:L-aspartate oxidase n=1 Tax=Aureibacter tunicatorum TaxID=866807 RepID=A0AAE3XHB3_9BACT|nr:L-aspartate oxidase [Aureibacter tunicatorum]MDR6237666.1 L-aspartate oxidase [Aureibacter tunicatorum]BDD02701.1 L-aspartate oxidase [Aureibacter tunicatorum]
MNTINSNFLVIGSGVAGLTFALKVAEYGKVHIVTKDKAKESNTRYAQGGIAAVTENEDSFELHKNDTFIAGAGLCHEDAVDVLVKEGPQRIKELIEFGAEFTKKADGTYSLAREGGHSMHRILHADDLTGMEIERALIEKTKAHPNIVIFEDHQAVELITEHHVLGNLSANFNICFGTYVLNKKTGKVSAFKSDYTLLASGGASRVFKHTTNPEIATGDGIAMAYRAGVRIANMEFIQFHPTSLYNTEGKTFLISEALRGHGGKLRNSKGELFMKKYDERQELAPRDIVARAIDAEIKSLGDECVYLDMTHLDDTSERFPNIYMYCLHEMNLDITKDLIPVVPAAHYVCGGIMTNLDGLTSMQNLYATGEVAHTGVHGANRLASNSLLEALVFSHRAAEKMIKKSRKNYEGVIIPEWKEDGVTDEEEWTLIRHNLAQIREVMSNYVGIIRSKKQLNRAYRRITMLHDEVEDYYKRTKINADLIELRNCTAIAYMIINSALRRNESRGLHYMIDYPETRESYLKNTIIK